MKSSGIILDQFSTVLSTERFRTAARLSRFLLSKGFGASTRIARQMLAAILCALLIPTAQGDLYAQQSAPTAETGQSATAAGPNLPAQSEGQPLTADQLGQLVAPIALYPDALVAQVLAASTYPTQVVEADRWRQAQGTVAAQQIAAGANNENWDPSVKALTAFPTVLAQMDRNLDWTTNLGNAYYNQPQDVMDAVQTMRHRATSGGTLRSTQQQTVSDNNGSIVIAPANPNVVYVPVYNPWGVYGAPLVVYPGFFYAPPPGVFFGAGIAIGFGIGIGIGAFGPWGWGWHNWNCGWHSHAVLYNHAAYITRSTTVINRGFNRPGGPPRGASVRGAYSRTVRGTSRNLSRVRTQRATQSFRSQSVRSQNIRSQGLQRSGSARINRSFGGGHLGGGRGFGGGGHMGGGEHMGGGGHMSGGGHMGGGGHAGGGGHHR